MPAAMSSSIVCTYSGSPTPRIEFVSSKMRLVSSRGMPIMSQMICSGSAAAISLTKSHSPQRRDAVDDLLRLLAHGVVDLRDLAGREAAVHDQAQLRVLRRVHVDHRAEPLRDLGGHVADVDVGAEWNVSGSRDTCITSA